MTLCIFKLVVVSFVGWVCHPASEEEMELLLVLACQLKLRKKPISLYLGGGMEGCKPGSWYLGFPILQRLLLGESIKAWFWLPKSNSLWLFCFRHGSTSLFHVAHPVWSCLIFLNGRKNRRRVGEAGGVVVVGSQAFPVGTFSFAMNLLDSWQVRSVDPSGHAMVSV